CIAPDNGSGTVSFPPNPCAYTSPEEVYQIIDGLPPGTTIELHPVHKAFYCQGLSDPEPCLQEPGGNLGGERQMFDTILVFKAIGTGDLSGFERMLILNALGETHSAPRTPGDPVQAFDTDWFEMQGMLFGDPDFDQLLLLAGTNFGLPSPGHTTLTSLENGYFHVDSFFDITYQVDFMGAPGGALDGLAGNTQGTIRIEATGTQKPCIAADDGTGSVELPPDKCDYYSPTEPMLIVDGLPPGTTIEIESLQTDFDCETPGCGVPGGGLGGEMEQFDSTWVLQLSGTGTLDGFRRTLRLGTGVQTHSGPRTPGDPVQAFNTELYSLGGALIGDPDFASFNLLAGSSLIGPSSPGWTLLSDQEDGTFLVDSFFDITYRVDFVGAPGGALDGLSGSTMAKVSHQAREAITPCIELDDGRGTVSLPPRKGQYQSLSDALLIQDGLPPGAEIGAEAILKDFVCLTSPCGQPGGGLGGEVEQFDATLELLLAGNESLAGFYRSISLPVSVETHSAPRVLGDPTQRFGTDLFSLQGSLLGDPDFDVISITVGTNHGLPSPGHTTLRDQGDGTFMVDSFFDISYRIDFVGAPGGALDGLSGTTVGTARLTAFADPDKARVADLSILKSVGSTHAAPGDLITYTLTFSNTGNVTANGVVITDRLPAELNSTGFTSLPGLGVTATGSFSYAWRVENLSPGEMGVITLTGQLSDGLDLWTSVVNTATISTTSYDDDSANDSSQAELSLCLSHITVSNAGDSGNGSLRQAISDACDGAIITFDDDYAIYLNSTLSVDKRLRIDGSGQSVTLSGDSGNDGSRDVQVLHVGSGGAVTLEHMRVVSGTVLSSGGGIYNSGTLTISHSTLAGNAAAGGSLSYRGGGLASIGTATVSNSTFSGNAASGSWGGGISNVSGVLTVRDSSFSDNAAFASGSGLSNMYGTATVINSTFAANETHEGGGISNYYGVLTVGNSSFSDNAALYYGGGLSNHHGTATVINSTFAANAASAGGGIFNDSGGTLHLQNTVVANSSGGDCDATLSTNTNNLIQDGSCGPALSGDPLLSRLGDYGGPLTGSGGPSTGSGQALQTFALLPGSPAIDVGDAATCASAPVNGVDQRGVERPQGAGCDIGAFESQGYHLSISGGDQQQAAINYPFPQPLQVTVQEDVSDVAIGPGTLITFRAPSSGASLAPPSFTATTDASGIASASATANGVVGTYMVTATAEAISQSVHFSLSNKVAYTLSVNTTSAGMGSVDPMGGVYPEGAVVTLTATPATGSYFSGWSGDVVSTTNPLAFTM
ncbi:MAG: choice-of-anchor Q domain-containing protein, partial [Anaerolineae bacterium]